MPTYLCADADDRAYVLEHLDELVVKAVDEAGGYGMLIGPRVDAPSERDEFRRRIVAEPRNYIAQPTIALSRHPTFVDGELRGPPRRPAAVRAVAARRHGIVPGGLTRDALRPGSLVVNSSQGGGSKDTWVLERPDAEPRRRIALLDGRYVERAEDVTRLLDVNFHALLDAQVEDRGADVAPDRAAARRRGALPRSTTTRRPRST